MTGPILRIDRSDWPEIQTDGVELIQDAGVAGAGGAGFPSYPKWEHANSTDYLLVNHQESEPNYYIDKWIGKEYAEEFATLFDLLVSEVFEVIVVGAKWKDREYLDELEAKTDGTVHPPDELPLDPEDESGVVFAYTENQYQYGMESVLLNTVADTVIGDDLPMDHGWIVQNTETLYNIYHALAEEEPVTRKYVHIDGEVPQHRFLDAPLGTPISEILQAAGLPPEEFPSDAVLAHGGPGWCFSIDKPVGEFGVRKHTNCILVLNKKTVEKNRLGASRIDVLDSCNWLQQDFETTPTEKIHPEYIRVPFITNRDFEGTVQAGEPVVEIGDDVETGEMIVSPNTDGISIPHHASIDGTVTGINDTCITIRSSTSETQTQSSMSI